MIITVEGLQVEVPEKYVEEYLGLIPSYSREDIANYLQPIAIAFKKDLIFNHDFTPESFQEKF